MAERDVSFRALARRTQEIDPRGKGLSHSYLGNLARGDDKTSNTDTMQLIAQALDVDPSSFTQYRLALARDLLDERVVGLPEAVKNLVLVEAQLHEEGMDGPPEGALVRLLGGAPPRSQGPGLSDSRGGGR